MDNKILNVLKYVVFFLNFGFPSYASTFFIGNGGEVVSINNNLYLRDLVESNLHLTPYFQCSTNVNSDVYKIHSHIIEELSLDRSLLSLKLCNLFEIRPEFSQVFINSINQFSWVLVDEELGSLELNDDIFNFPRDTKKTIANRTLNQIRIQRHLWEALNPKHRIALIFHETLYSLLRPECVNPTCLARRQSPRIAREITSLLFMKEAFTKNKLFLIEKQLLTLLNVTLTSQESLTSTMSLNLLADDSRIEHIKKRPEENFLEFSLKACQMILSYPKQDKNFKLAISLLKPGNIKIEKISFQSEYSLEYALRVYYSDSFLIVKKMDVPLSVDSCQQELEKLME